MVVAISAAVVVIVVVDIGAAVATEAPCTAVNMVAEHYRRRIVMTLNQMTWLRQTKALNIELFFCLFFTIVTRVFARGCRAGSLRSRSCW